MNVKDSTSDHAPSSLSDTEDIPATDNTSCSHSRPDQQQQEQQEQEQQQRQAIGKSTAAQAPARSAFTAAGCRFGRDVTLSDPDSDDESNHEEDFMNSLAYVEEVVPDSEGATHYDEENGNTLAADAAAVLASLDAPSGSTSPPPEEQLVVNDKEKAEAAARSAFLGEGCAIACEIVLSDVDEDADSDDGSQFECGSLVDGVEAIEAMLDEADAARRRQDNKTTVAADAAATLTALDGASGLVSPPPKEQVPQVNEGEPRNAAALGSSTGAGGAAGSGVVSSCRTSDEGSDRGCFQPSSSAVLPKCSAPLEGTPPVRPSGVLSKSSAPPLDDTLPATPSSLFSPPRSLPSPPPPPPPPPPPSQRLGLSGTGENVVNAEPQRPVLLKSSAPPLDDTSQATPSSLFSPPRSSPPPPPPPSPSQRLGLSGTGRNGVNAEPLQMHTSVAPELSVSNDNSLSPPPPPPPPVVQALASPPPSSPALDAPVPPPPPCPPFNPLKGLFSQQLDTPGFASRLGDVLYRGGVLPVSSTSRQALKAAGRGEATSEMMESVIRGMNSKHGTANLARENGGAKFVGPKARTPSYKTKKGLSRLLNEISKRHEVGSKFVVCLDSPLRGTKARVVTGVVSKVEVPPFTETDASSGWGIPLPSSPTEALIHGDGREMSVDQWISVNGDIGAGQRLSAWVY